MIFRRFLVTLFSLAFLFPSIRAAEGARTAYVIIDSQTGFVLEQVDARDKRQIGSLTKVATAMVVLCGGYLGMFTGFSKAFSELCLLVAGVGVFGLSTMKDGRGLVLEALTRLAVWPDQDG